MVSTARPVSKIMRMASSVRLADPVGQMLDKVRHVRGAGVHGGVTTVSVRLNLPRSLFRHMFNAAADRALNTRW